MRIAIVNDNDMNLIIMKHIIDTFTDNHIAWLAMDGHEAIRKCQDDVPDLILMDMIMPGMNGVEASRVIMQETPCAILIVTATVSGNAAMVFEAMSCGALDVVKTPFSGMQEDESEMKDFLHKLKVVNNLIHTNSRPKVTLTNNKTPETSSHNKIVVIGASTGGPGVLATILKDMPADFSAPIIIVQHVDSSFMHNFASWLNKQSDLTVRIAQKGERPQPGTVLIAGKSEHLIMTNGEKLEYSELHKELAYKPSVDVFFNSIEKHWKGDTIAVLLTGMGKDGAAGLASIKKSGGHTITQTKETCTVYGMPKAADDIGASVQSLAPHEIPAVLTDIVKK